MQLLGKHSNGKERGSKSNGCIFQICFLVYLRPQDLISIHSAEPHGMLSLKNDSTLFSVLSSLHFNLFSFHLYIYRLKLQNLNLSPLSCVPFFPQLFSPTLYDTLVFMQTLMNVTLPLQHSFVFKPKCLNDCGTLTYLLLPATALFSVHLSKTLLLKAQYR